MSKIVNKGQFNWTYKIKKIIEKQAQFIIVAIEITTGRRSEKRLISFQNRGVATIVFMENHAKPKKNKDKASLRRRYQLSKTPVLRRYL